jgi:hypothetical protein
MSTKQFGGATRVAPPIFLTPHLESRDPNFPFVLSVTGLAAESKDIYISRNTSPVSVTCPR